MGRLSPPEQTGPPDFDTRPSEPERSLIRYWVSECPYCGYCADDLTAIHEGVEAIVRSPEYREQLENFEVPEAARRFLCYASILAMLHYWADSGWTCLHAAWACDDEGAQSLSINCRALAIERWKRGKELGQNFADDLASEFAIVTDLYRRIGEFEEATIACAEGLDLDDISPVVEQMLRRQMVLIQRRDTVCHSMAELQSD
jgi:hypothetical protein